MIVVAARGSYLLCPFALEAVARRGRSENEDTRSGADPDGPFHSLEDHGALSLAPQNPGRCASVSAAAPIVAQIEVPWVQTALAGHLDDRFLARELQPEGLVRASLAAAQGEPS